MPVLEASGARHYYRLEGEAGRPVLVLLHALGTDHSLWDALVAELPHWRVLRYDLRGHGGSDVPSGECSVEQLANDLLEITRALGLDEFVIAGVSLGALVAVTAAARVPGRIRALALCSASTRIPGPPNGGWEARARTALDAGMDSLAPAMMARMFSPAWLERREPQAGSIEHVFRATDPRGYAACCAALRDADVSKTARDVAAPAIVVRGSSDALITREAASALANELPNAMLCMLDAAHYPMVEDAQAFAQQLMALSARAEALQPAS